MSNNVRQVVTRTNIASINPYEGRIGLVYARVSSKKQEMEGSGLESQESRCIQYLESVHVPHEKTYAETFSGGGDFMNRPEMRQMLADIDANPDKKFLLVFDDLKRFARDTQFHIKLRIAFRARDVLLHCLNFDFNDSEEGEFLETLFAAQGQLERKQNARQVIQKMRARMDAGYWTFGTKKGYSFDKDALHGKILKPNAESALIVEAIEGILSKKFIRKIDVCKFLLEKGFWKGQEADKYIYRLTLMLSDVFYAGYIEYSRPRWEVTRRLGHHQGIISLEKFEYLQRWLRKEKMMVRVRQDITPDFPVRGLVVCDHCGKHLTAAWSKKVFGYYICHNKLCEQYGKSIPKSEIETQFISLLQKSTLKTEIGSLVELVFERVWEQEMQSVKALEAGRAKERKQLEDKATQLTNLIIGAKSAQIKSVYETQLDDVAIKLDELGTESITKTDFQIPYRTALGKAIGLLKNPYFTWQAMDVFQQHRLFFFIFGEKLPYNQITGYRTDRISSIFRLFNDFSMQNTNDVDPPGIEPGPRPCHGRVMPIYYGPLFKILPFFLVFFNKMKALE